MPRPYRRRPAPGPRRPTYTRAQTAEILASNFINEAVGEWRCDLTDYPSMQRFGKAVMEWARGAPRPDLPAGTELVRGFDRLLELIAEANAEREAQAQPAQPEA